MIALFKIIINQMICAKMKPCMHNSEIARIFNLEIIKSGIIYCCFMIAIHLNHTHFITKYSNTFFRATIEKWNIMKKTYESLI